MTSPESPAILYEHADGRRAVVSANRVATFAIDNPDWHRAGPVEIVWVDDAAPAWRPIETAPKDGSIILLGSITNEHVMVREARFDDETSKWSWPWFCGISPDSWLPLPPSPSSADEGGSNG